MKRFADKEEGREEARKSPKHLQHLPRKIRRRQSECPRSEEKKAPGKSPTKKACKTKIRKSRKNRGKDRENDPGKTSKKAAKPKTDAAC